MRIDASTSELREIQTKLVDRNPENPRLLFRQDELDELTESIRQWGVQVPISVYREHGRYVLIDGERRWRVSVKLNKATIPALVQDKPDSLTNLLLMFNIHALREQWDLLTIALKLPRMTELLNFQLGREANEREISKQTGLKLSVIRRCKLLVELPEHHKQEILKELQKPKPQQRLTEDFFIEMERALKTVERAMPELIENKDKVRHVLISKYRKGVIKNIVQFRNVAKIARAKTVDADVNQARKSLGLLFEDNSYSIDKAFGSSVAWAYAEKDLVTRITALTEKLQALERSDLDEEVVEALRILREQIDILLA